MVETSHSSSALRTDRYELTMLAAALRVAEERIHRTDLAADRRQHHVDQLLAPLAEVGMRIFLVEHDHVGEFAPFHRQVAVKVKQCADRHIGPDDLPHLHLNGEMDEAIADTRKLLGGVDDEKVWGTLIDMYYYRLEDARAPADRLV